MRITVEIDDDVLAAAKRLAAGQRTTLGNVISRLTRQALAQRRVSSKHQPMRNGLPQLPRTRGAVTNEMIEQLLEPKYDSETGLWDA